MSGAKPGASRSGGRAGGVPLAALPAFVIVGVLTAAGVLGAIRTSLRLGVVGERGFGTGAWSRLLVDSAFLEAVSFTLWVAAASAVLSVVGGFALAVWLEHRPWARSMLALPVATPHLVVAALAVTWAAPGGLLDRALGSLPLDLIGNRSGWGVILVYVLKEVPFVTLVAMVALDDEVRELEETASVLGAGRRQRLRDVVGPALFRPLMATGLVVAAFVVGAVEVPILVGPTRPRLLGPYSIDLVLITGPSARADAAAAELVSLVITVAIGTAGALVIRAWRR